VVISFLNVGIDSLVMTFLLHSIVKCGMYCHLFSQEVKLNLSLHFIKLHTLEWGYSTLVS